MKFLVAFVLALATASAFSINGHQELDVNLYVPTVEQNIIDGRIINGQRAVVGQFPYQVSLNAKVNILSSFSCGGSVIAADWILTAAHCVDATMQSLTIRYGSIQRTSGGVAVVIEDMSQITIHPGWNSKTAANDIAVIRTPKVTLGATIAPVKLPKIAKTYSTYAGDVGIASGFGKTKDSDAGASSYLSWAPLEFITNTVCARTYGLSVSSGNLCAATVGASSTCSGDSGGPVVVGDVQVGLTSYGHKDGCELGYYVAFTRLTVYVEWLKEVTGVSY